MIELKNIAYCWYRPLYEPFSPGKTLNLITDLHVISAYVSNPKHQALCLKYFPDGMNIHGLSTLTARPTKSKYIGPVIEIVFELVRQLHFPDAPSRLACLYATQSLEQAETWRQILRKNPHRMPNQTLHSLWEIAYDTDARLYDAVWLDAASEDRDGNDVISYLSLMDSACQYWSRAFTASPKPELLVPYPVTVLRILRRNIDSE